MIFYRYDYYSGEEELTERKFNKVKETLCGYWIKEQNSSVMSYSWFFGDSKKRWIPKVSRKRFAYPTKKEALVSFMARKAKQVEINNYQISTANKGFDLAKKLQENLKGAKDDI